MLQVPRSPHEEADRPLVTYEPNPMLSWVYERFFSHIQVDERWVAQVREAEKRGSVVYVLRNLSFVDFVALDHLTKRHGLPKIRFANDFGLWVLEPFGRGWGKALTARTPEGDASDLQRALKDGGAAVLFLKRPATLLEPKTRGKVEGDHLTRALVEFQRTTTRPVLLIPQVFVWSKSADEKEHSFADGLFGPREWPGPVRSVAQFLANYRHVTLRAGEPLSVAEFLKTEAEAPHEDVEEREARDGPPSDDVLVRRITYVLLRRLQRERRSVLGPARKPPDRLREEVIRSPKLQKVIHDMAGPGEAERQVITWRALSMLREMEAALDVNAVAAMEKLFDQISSRMYSAVEVDELGVERLRALAKDGTLILLPSHKSHVDYMVLAQLFYRHKMQLPLIAAGDNLNFFPLGPLFRRAGAFFIRRSFRGDRLYAAVVDAYMRRLLKDGWALEFFLEGGRSRTGKLLDPKVGLLSIVVDAALGVTNRPVYFCPISIGYERLVEEKAYVREMSGGEKKKEDVRGLLSVVDVIIGRYGRLNVQVGEPLTLAEVAAEAGKGALPSDPSAIPPARRRALVMRLAFRVMNELNRVTAVTPGALVAMALLAHKKRGLPHSEFIALAVQIAVTLRRFGARFSPSLAPVGDDEHVRTSALTEACDLFARAGHVEVRNLETPRDGAMSARASEEAFYVVPDSARLSLDLAKNIVIHFFVSRALVATAVLALLAGDPAGVSVPVVRERVLALSKLFKFEFQFRADAPFDQIFEEELRAMVRDDELVVENGTVKPNGPHGLSQLELYERIVRNFLEGYRIAARAMTALLRGPLAQKDLTKRAITVGERMFLEREIECREAVSRPLFENAIAVFAEQGYLGRTDGKIMLLESYSTQTTVRTIEAKIAGMIAPSGTWPNGA